MFKKQIGLRKDNFVILVQLHLLYYYEANKVGINSTVLYTKKHNISFKFCKIVKNNELN